MIRMYHYRNVKGLSSWELAPRSAEMLTKLKMIEVPREVIHPGHALREGG